MSLNINKVVDFVKGNTQWWHDGLANGEIIEEDNKTIFNTDDYSLSLSVEDNKVTLSLKHESTYDEEKYYSTREYNYLDNMVLVKCHEDKYYYDDVRPERGKEIPLRHIERDYEVTQDLDKTISINELYTPSKTR